METGATEVDWDTAEGEEFAEPEAARARYVNTAFRGFRNSSAKGAARLYRKATFGLLMVINRVLSLLTGQGQEQCRQPALNPSSGASTDPPPAPACTLFLAGDPCSVVTYAGSFLNQRLSLHVEQGHNPCHRYWNSDNNGLAAAGAWTTVLLFISPFNVNFGPFKWGQVGGGTDQSQGRVHQADRHRRLSRLQLLVAEIARERGQLDQVGNPK